MIFLTTESYNSYSIINEIYILSTFHKASQVTDPRTKSCYVIYKEFVTIYKEVPQLLAELIRSEASMNIHSFIVLELFHSLTTILAHYETFP